MIWLGQAALHTTRLPEVVHPYLEDLFTKLGETVVLTILEGDEVIYVDRIEADHVIVERTHLGSRLPAYCTATGQVLLSGLSGNEVRQRLAGTTLIARGPNTLTSLSAVLERLAEIRRRGFAINDEELAIGHRSAAVPVLDHDGQVVAAISVSVAAGRVSPSEVQRFASEYLVPAAAAASAELGAPAESPA
jgi:IclR family pca regulon transcriptional regulator